MSRKARPPLALCILAATAGPAFADSFAQSIAPLAASGAFAPSAPRPLPPDSITPLARLSEPAYADGTSAPAGPNRPSARAISNFLAANPIDIGQTLPPLSNLAVAALQLFASHEIARTPTLSDPAEAFDIPVAPGDPLGVPTPQGPVIPMQRSRFETGPAGERVQVNDVSPFFDASTVYGSDRVREGLLRADNGRLATSPDNGLPVIGGRPAAGDVRADENNVLRELHVVYMREHNRIADAIGQACSDQGLTCSSDDIYYGAQRAVTLGQQKVFYEEVLPTFLGTRDLRSLVPDQSVFDRPGLVFNEATAAALRTGHTQVPEIVTAELPGAPARSATISDCLFFGSCLDGATTAEVLYGASRLAAEPVDLTVAEGLRNGQLATPFSTVPIDLLATNIQRGRDHGLAAFDQVRASLGFDPKDVTEVLPEGLIDLYAGATPDLLVMLFGEAHMPGAHLGETAAAIWGLQFGKLKEADPDFYTKLPAGDPMWSYLENTTFSALITRNTGLADDAFAQRDPVLAPVAVAPVPLPPGALAFASALALLGAVRRRAGRAGLRRGPAGGGCRVVFGADLA